MALKTCPKCAAQHGPRKKMCPCGHYFPPPGRERQAPHPLYPEPGEWVLEARRGLPVLDLPEPLPRGELLDTDAIRSEYVAYEGLGYCIYSYIPAERIRDYGLQQKWIRARAAMQEVVEYLNVNSEEREMQDQLEHLRDTVQNVINNVISKRDEARDARVSVIFATGLLRDTLRQLPLPPMAPRIQEAIQAAKEACEVLAIRATQATENGDLEFGEFLCEQVNNLAPVVARLISTQEASDAETA